MTLKEFPMQTVSRVKLIWSRGHGEGGQWEWRRREVDWRKCLENGNFLGTPKRGATVMEGPSKDYTEKGHVEVCAFRVGIRSCHDMHRGKSSSLLILLVWSSICVFSPDHPAFASWLFGQGTSWCIQLVSVAQVYIVFCCNWCTWLVETYILVVFFHSISV
jgi:hypothetical protein